MHGKHLLWLLALPLSACASLDAAPPSGEVPTPPAPTAEPPAPGPSVVANLERSLTSPSGEVLVHWLVRLDGSSEFLFLPKEPEGAGSVCAPLPGVIVRSSASSLRWSEDDVLLLRWGAGSGVDQLIAFGPECRLILALSAPLVELSPDGRIAMGYPGVGAALAEAREVNVYDTRTGERIRKEPLPADSVVAEVRWTETEARLVVQGRDGTRAERTLSLKPGSSQR